MRGLLPSLQSGLGPLPKSWRTEPADVFWTKTKQGVRLMCDTRFAVPETWAPPSGNQSPTEAELVELLRGWFAYVPVHQWDSRAGR
jgi:hypothetical protein